MPATNYVVTVQRPTAVSAIATGNFTSSADHNLIVAKNTYLDIYLIDSEGLKLVKDVPIYGRINILRCFRLPNMDKDVIFILTDKHHGMILDCSKREHQHYEIVTLGYGSLKDTSRPSIRRPLCSIDAKHGLIVLRLVDGMIKVIQLKDLASQDSPSKHLEAYNIKIDDPHLIDLQFLPGHSRPTFVTLSSAKPEINYINSDQAEQYHLRAYQIRVTECDLITLPWKKTVTLSEASYLIPIGQATFSCLVVGLNQIALYHENEDVLEVESALLEETTCISGYCSIDDGSHRYLLTDLNGKLYALMLEYGRQGSEDVSNRCTKIKLDCLGHVSNGEFVTYLDNSVAFIGSRFGDSQLIRLLPEAQNGSYIELMESYPNIGPIVDMCMIDLERQSRQLVTCSGYDKDSSLRFIRTGIGIQEYASIDLRNIKGIWPLKVDNQYDNHLVVAFFDQTRLFQLQNDEIEEVELSGFEFRYQTLFCANVRLNQYLQITTNSIRLIGNHGRDVLVEWKNDNKEITVATSNTTQCVCASGNELFYFEIGQGSINQISHATLPHNVACLDISPLNADAERTDLCVVGLWTQISVWIYRLPNLDVLHKEPLTSDTLPRSVATITFDGQPYVFISLADGPLVYYFLDTEHGRLYERKKVPLGTKPTTLTICQHTDLSSPASALSTGRRVLFACSDRPSVISALNGKLIFSAVNRREIVCMCSFHSEFYGSCLTLVTDTGTIFGRIDDLQKLHIRSLPLGESVRRMVFIEEEQAFVLLTHHIRSSRGEQVAPISKQAQQRLECPTLIKSLEHQSQIQGDQVRGSIVVLDQHTHEARATVKLLNGEEAYSACVLHFSGDLTGPYIAVGTIIAPELEQDRKYGRILLLRYKNGQMTIVKEKEVNAGPYQLLPFQGRLLAAIGNKIHLFKFSSDSQELTDEFKPHTGHVESLQLKVKDDFVLYADLMNSITILRYNTSENKFEKIAYNPHVQWSTACEFLDDETFLCSVDDGNLLTCHKNSDSTKEQEQNVLAELGLWHLGEDINVFRHADLGCLVNLQATESSVSLESCTLMGAVSGYIGLVLQLSPALYQLLLALQQVLAEHVPSVGKVEHNIWRFFQSELGSKPSSGFVDGDLIETYLDLPKSIQSDLIKNLRGDNDLQLNTTVEELVKTIEDLSRIH